MIYKRFIFATFSFTILLTFLFGIINLFFYKVPQNTLWIKNCFTIKDKYADSIKTKKIVFSSGSNTLYGLNTIEIEKNIGIKSVNLAIHAGLQTDYILYRTKKVLKPGDIVVLPFEYQMLTWNGEDDDTRTDYILTHDKIFFLVI